jgi:hypothetical protein
VTEIHFFPADPADDNPDYDDTGCPCKPGDNRYQLEIDEGGVILIHVPCGKQPSASWGDWGDLVYMDPIPVTVKWDTNCNGSAWHGDRRCECDRWIQVTPGTDLSQELPHRPCFEVTYAPKRKPHSAHHYRFQRRESYWCPGLAEEDTE